MVGPVDDTIAGLKKIVQGVAGGGGQIINRTPTTFLTS